MIDVYWKEIFKYNLSVYIQIINCHLFDNGYTTVQINKTLKKLSFPLPKGLLKKEIEGVGTYPVVSQSKEEVIGRSNRKDLLVEKDLPLIVYGDHSKTIKYIDYSFVVGADGIKLLKPNSSFYEKYFYYSLIGTQTDIKNYGRHFSLLKNKSIMFPDIKLQKKIALFLDDFSDENIRNSMYFDEKIENKIMALHENSIKGLELKTELTYQQTLIKKLRQQILQEAIEGKLTTEWRKRFSPPPRGRAAKQGGGKYEHASVLLERIIAKKNQMIKDKKIKPHKTLPPISDEDKPFPLPPGWSASPLANCSFNKDESRIPITKSNRDIRDKKYDYYGASGVIDKIDGYTHKGRHLLIGEDGANLVARSTPIAFFADGKFWVNNHAHVIGTVDSITLDYLWVHINAIDLKPYISGGFQPKLSQANLNRIIINFPPLAEQKAIVAKVEKLLALCDQLETKITENKTHAKQLMREVLKEVFAQK